jgi:hypothetical protein
MLGFRLMDKATFSDDITTHVFLVDIFEPCDLRQQRFIISISGIMPAVVIQRSGGQRFGIFFVVAVIKEAYFLNL